MMVTAVVVCRHCNLRFRLMGERLPVLMSCPDCLCDLHFENERYDVPVEFVMDLVGAKKVRECRFLHQGGASSWCIVNQVRCPDAQGNTPTGCPLRAGLLVYGEMG